MGWILSSRRLSYFSIHASAESILAGKSVFSSSMGLQVAEESLHGVTKCDRFVIE